VVGVFQRSDARDIDDAVAAAKQAWEQWRLVPAPKRAEIIFRCGEILQQRKEEYSQLMTREMGKVLKGNARRRAGSHRYRLLHGGLKAVGCLAQTVPSELPDKFAMAVRTPIGVCGMIAPWNFPMAIPSWKIFPALVCGNTCVIKPAEDTPLSTINLVTALMEAGLPKGVVNIVTGFGPDAGAPIVEHADVRAISFTGSSEVGRIVGEKAAHTFKPCSLEMGGKNAIIVLDDANLDLALDGHSVGRVRHHRTALHRHQPRDPSERHLQTVRGQTGRPRQTAQGRQRSRRGAWTWVRKSTSSRSKPAENTWRSVRSRALRWHSAAGRCSGSGYDNGWFFQPTIFTDVDAKMRIAQEEIFGPVLSLIPCDDYDQAIEIANGVAYGLSSSLYTRDVNKAFRAMRDIYAGITYVNAPTIGAEVHLPFGGTKSTGNGHREGGLERSISTHSGSRFTWISRTDCRGLRSITRSEVKTGQPRMNAN